MKALTKAKMFFGLVAVLAVVTLVYSTQDPKVRTDEDDKEVVKLISSFANTRPVIVYQVGAHPPVGQSPTGGLWDMQVTAEKGERVILTATITGGEVILYIVHREVISPCDPRSLYGPGTISCQYVVA